VRHATSSCIGFIKLRNVSNRDDIDWLTLGQAARYLGVAQGTIRKWADQSRVPAFYTPGGHRRFRRADLEAFLGLSGPPRRTKASPRVLLVVDDEQVRALVCEALQLEGYTVAEAGSIDAALVALDEVIPDLVLAKKAADGVDPSELQLRVDERYGLGVIPVLTFVCPSEHDADIEQLLAQARQLAPLPI
jgi:excisionase family DNA binding protein